MASLFSPFKHFGQTSRKFSVRIELHSACVHITNGVASSGTRHFLPLASGEVYLAVTRGKKVYAQSDPVKFDEAGRLAWADEVLEFPMTLYSGQQQQQEQPAAAAPAGTDHHQQATGAAASAEAGAGFLDAKALGISLVQTRRRHQGPRGGSSTSSAARVVAEHPGLELSRFVDSSGSGNQRPHALSLQLALHEPNSGRDVFHGYRRAYITLQLSLAVVQLSGPGAPPAALVPAPTAAKPQQPANRASDRPPVVLRAASAGAPSPRAASLAAQRILDKPTASPGAAGAAASAARNVHADGRRISSAPLASPQASTDHLEDSARLQKADERLRQFTSLFSSSMRFPRQEAELFRTVSEAASEMAAPQSPGQPKAGLLQRSEKRARSGSKASRRSVFGALGLASSSHRADGAADSTGEDSDSEGLLDAPQEPRATTGRAGTLAPTTKPRANGEGETSVVGLKPSATSSSSSADEGAPRTRPTTTAPRRQQRRVVPPPALAPAAEESASQQAGIIDDLSQTGLRFDDLSAEPLPLRACVNEFGKVHDQVAAGLAQSEAVASLFAQLAQIQRHAAQQVQALVERQLQQIGEIPGRLCDGQNWTLVESAVQHVSGLADFYAAQAKNAQIVVGENHLGWAGRGAGSAAQDDGGAAGASAGSERLDLEHARSSTALGGLPISPMSVSGSASPGGSRADAGGSAARRSSVANGRGGEPAAEVAAASFAQASVAGNDARRVLVRHRQRQQQQPQEPGARPLELDASGDSLGLVDFLGASQLKQAYICQREADVSNHLNGIFARLQRSWRDADAACTELRRCAANAHVVPLDGDPKAAESQINPFDIDVVPAKDVEIHGKKPSLVNLRRTQAARQAAARACTRYELTLFRTQQWYSRLCFHTEYPRLLVDLQELEAVRVGVLQRVLDRYVQHESATTDLVRLAGANVSEAVRGLDATRDAQAFAQHVLTVCGLPSTAVARTGVYDLPWTPTVLEVQMRSCQRVLDQLGAKQSDSMNVALEQFSLLPASVTDDLRSFQKDMQLPESELVKKCQLFHNKLRPDAADQEYFHWEQLELFLGGASAKGSASPRTREVLDELAAHRHEQFHKFLERSMVEENILFYTAATELLQADPAAAHAKGSSTTKYGVLAQDLLNEYLVIGAPHEINLSFSLLSSMRKAATSRQYVQFHELVDKAREQVVKLMRDGNFVTFLRSPEFLGTLRKERALTKKKKPAQSKSRGKA